jgi:hypothetical protein
LCAPSGWPPPSPPARWQGQHQAPKRCGAGCRSRRCADGPAPVCRPNRWTPAAAAKSSCVINASSRSRLTRAPIDHTSPTSTTALISPKSIPHQRPGSYPTASATSTQTRLASPTGLDWETPIDNVTNPTTEFRRQRLGDTGCGNAAADLYCTTRTPGPFKKTLLRHYSITTDPTTI